MSDKLHDEPMDRRTAIKKAAVAGAVVGAVWSAPKIEGLTLRPNYASAGTQGESGSAGFTASPGQSAVSQTIPIVCCGVSGTLQFVKQSGNKGAVDVTFIFPGTTFSSFTHTVTGDITGYVSGGLTGSGETTPGNNAKSFTVSWDCLL